ncbi:MAG: nucleoside deaminase [Micrococcales bacterium]
MDYQELMKLALAQAETAAQVSGDVPVGAVIVDSSGAVVSVGRNQRELLDDPTSHAEIEAIRAAAAQLGDWRLDNCTLVVTLEPCAMCAGAIVAARIPRVIFGAWDERVGAAGSLYDLLRDSRLGQPAEVIGGVLEAECAAQLREFFEAKR